MNTLCIITPGVGWYSETFIQNHIELLAGEKYIVTLSDGVFADENGSYIGRHSTLFRSYRFVRRRLLGETFYSQQVELLAQYLDKHRIDHALIEYGTTAKRCYEACVKAGVPYTVHFHGYDAYKFDYARKEFYTEIFKHARWIVVVSNHMRKKLISIDAPSERVHVIPYGTDFKDEFGAVKAGSKLKDFLTVGRFVEKKAPYLTILSFAEALRHEPDIRLVMAGDGLLLPMCRSIAKSLKIHDRVTFTGALKHEEVRKLMGNCDAFIQHSVEAANGDSEGLPVAIIEALALKKPVISTRHSGIPEIVFHEENGLLCDEHDVSTMAENILKVARGYSFNFTNTISLSLPEQIQKLNDLLADR